jgi:hypothetical protein
VIAGATQASGALNLSAGGNFTATAAIDVTELSAGGGIGGGQDLTANRIFAGGAVTAQNVKAGSLSAGSVSAGVDVKVSGGRVALASGGTANGTFSANGVTGELGNLAASNIVLNGSVLTATGISAADSLSVTGDASLTVSGAGGRPAVSAETGIDLGEGLFVLVPAGGSVGPCGDGVAILDASGNPAETVVIGPQPPVVSNVAARQRWPWNGLVDVDYAIAGRTTGLVARIVVSDAAGGRSWTATNFLAGAAPSVEPGAHRATWDTAADGAPNVVARGVVATVELVSRDLEASVEPSAIVLPGTARLAVRGDGRDVTGWCTFESGDEGVARVDEDGVVTAADPGTCEIRVAYARTDGTTLRGTVALRVDAPTVLDADDPDPIPVDARRQLHVRYAGADVTGDCSFASSDDDVATVDEYGYVTGVSEGTAEITVTYRPEKPRYPESVEVRIPVTVE